MKVMIDLQTMMSWRLDICRQDEVDCRKDIYNFLNIVRKVDFVIDHSISVQILLFNTKNCLYQKIMPYFGSTTHTYFIHETYRRQIQSFKYALQCLVVILPKFILLIFTNAHILFCTRNSETERERERERDGLRRKIGGCELICKCLC